MWNGIALYQKNAYKHTSARTSQRNHTSYRKQIVLFVNCWLRTGYTVGASSGSNVPETRKEIPRSRISVVFVAFSRHSLSYTTHGLQLLRHTDAPRVRVLLRTSEQGPLAT